MTTFLKRHMPILAAICILILGGAVAAMAAGGTSAAGHHHHAGIHSGRARRLLASAAAYIGIPEETLATDLRSGKSLGQIAIAAGKTEAGLVKALTATASAATEQRLSALVKRPGGLQARQRSAHALRQAAATYLGVSLAQLRTDLRAGKTLAEIADSTPGRSSAGLVSALVAAREAQISAGRKSSTAGSISAVRTAQLRRRITRLVEHSHLRTLRHRTAAG